MSLPHLPMSTASRSAFCGSHRKLVLAFDVGTTYSGISYSVLDPGEIPEIKRVTKFPAQEYISEASKIPTTIYYDPAGNVKAVGAEAAKEGIFELAEDERWVKAEWFKLHLRSRVGAGKKMVDEIPPLNKTVTDIFADFLAYLLECASSFIQNTRADGARLWESVKDELYFVLPHPNGWEGAQQAEMRKAALLAKLIPDTAAGHARLSFVTEGEASLHFAIQNGLPVGVMEDGEGVVIVDAGGGTIDISSYSKSGGELKTRFEEVAPPQGYFGGSVFVTVHARQFLENYLQNSTFLDDIEHIVGCFDKTTKLRFQNSVEPQYIKFGGTRDNDPSCNIRFGQLKLLGSDVAKFFEPSVECTVHAVLEQCRTAHRPISHVILVGGLATSDWLFDQVHQKLLPHGLNIVRPQNHVNKAVSDGALSYYHNHFVSTRVSKFTYGLFCNTLFNPSVPDHQERSHHVRVSASGRRLLPGFFDVILPKNTQVSETKEFREQYFHHSELKDGFQGTPTSLWCYRGEVVAPRWMDVDTQNYTMLCTLEVDISQLPMSCRRKISGEGVFYRIDYDIVLLFGLTELKAMLAWKENGVERRSPAQIIYNPVPTDDPF